MLGGSSDSRQGLERVGNWELNCHELGIAHSKTWERSRWAVPGTKRWDQMKRKPLAVNHSSTSKPTCPQNCVWSVVISTVSKTRASSISLKIKWKLLLLHKVSVTNAVKSSAISVAEHRTQGGSWGINYIFLETFKNFSDYCFPLLWIQ